MIMFFYLLPVLFFIPLILMTLNFLISKKFFQNREKMSPFECGFDPISASHLPFSVHFFMISLIFLIFDIEIAILIPLVFMTMTFNLSFLLSSLLIMLILILGLFLEYSEKSIDWKM